VDENNLLAGDFVFGVVNLFAEGQEGKKLMAAGNAAEGGNAERTPEGSAKTLGEFRGDALDFNIAADGTVRGEQVGERCGARTKAPRTTRTTPWNNQERWRHSQGESVGESGGTPSNYMLGKSSE